MARGGNGHKDPMKQVVEELQAMRADMNNGFSLLSSRINDVSTRLDVTNARLTLVEQGLVQVNTRLDRLIENTGGHYRKLEDRVAALEAKVH